MSKEHVRLIDANALKKRVVKVMFRDCPESGEFYAVGTDDIDIMPTIDPESLRPTAHIMRGTVPNTHDDSFCSNCRSYLGIPGVDYEDYDSVLSHRYKYCPYCNARIVSADE